MSIAPATQPATPTHSKDPPRTDEERPIQALTFVNPPGLYDPRPNAYSHLALFPAGWRLIMPAGQGGENDRGELPPTFAAQLRQVLKNTETVLAAAGARMGDVAKFNLLVVDHGADKFAAIREEFDRVWGDTKPAWTLIPVPALALAGMLVEIDVIAVLPADAAPPSPQSEREEG